MTTDHPVAHSTEAVAAPIPDPPPVITATGACERSTSTGASNTELLDRALGDTS